MGEETLQALNDLTPKGTCLYTTIKHVSRGGMSREISVYVVHNERIRNINYYVGEVLGLRIGNHNGLVVKGCGMDMGYAIVSSVSEILYADNYALRHEHLF